MPKDHISRPGLPLNNPTSITLHWIGPYPRQTPEIVRNWWLRGSDGKGVEASAHYIIKDDLVLQCIPEHEVAWHCGSKGNYSSIGIELIPMNTTGMFSLKTIDSLKEVLKLLPNVELKRHYDWTGKDCPRYYTPIVGMVGADGRVENPSGGEQRWIDFIKELRGEEAA